MHPSRPTRPTRSRPFVALAAALASALVLTACGGVSATDRTDAAALVATLGELQGVSEVAIDHITNEPGLGYTKVLAVNLKASAGTPSALADSLAAMSAAARESASAKRGYQVFVDAVANLDGTPVEAHLSYRDPGDATDLLTNLEATLPEALEAGSPIVLVGESPLACSVTFAEVPVEQMVEIALRPIPDSGCLTYRRSLHPRPSGTRFYEVPDGPGLDELWVAGRPGTTPPILPVDALAGLLGERAIVGIHLGLDGTVIEVDPSRTMVEDENGMEAPVPDFHTLGPLPSEDAVRTGLRTIKDFDGRIRVQVQIPEGADISGGNGTLEISESQGMAGSTRDPRLFDLYTRVADAL